MGKHQILIFMSAIFLLWPTSGCTTSAKGDTALADNTSPPTVTQNIGATRDKRNLAGYLFRPDLSAYIQGHVSGIHTAAVFVSGKNAYASVNNGTMPSFGTLRSTEIGGTTSSHFTDGTKAGTITGGVVSRTANNQTNVPLSLEQRQQIALEIKRMAPSISTVYVSDDPALFDRFRGYGTGTSIHNAAATLTHFIQQLFHPAH